MRNVGRKLAFVLAASNHGTMILNRFDSRVIGPDLGYGVSHQILEAGAFDPLEIETALQLLDLRKRCYGDGVVAIDCGANIGAHTIEWAAAMTGWGSVIAIEAQERLYYALAGNIAINNCFNAVAINAAASSETGVMKIPVPDYLTASSFGSLELRQRDNNEFIGQAIDYSEERCVAVQMITLDAMNLSRVDLIKIDVEGMEVEVLQGAQRTIESCHPVILVEIIKSNSDLLRGWLEERGYKIMEAGINILAIHASDVAMQESQSKAA